MIIGPGGIPKFAASQSDPDPDRINLKNGRARQPYATEIGGYCGIVVVDDGGTGLSVTDIGDVSGGPIPAGDYTLALTAMKSGQPVTLHARLSVIADPRDLWVNVPSDQVAPLAKPDEDFDAQSAAAFVVAASTRGRSHAQDGTYRDDDFRISADVDTGWHILVVADGAGSATLSREGSRIACDAVMDALPDLLARLVDPFLEQAVGRFDASDAWDLQVRDDMLYPVLPQAALDAVRVIEATAIGMDRPPQDFATTLVIAVSRQVLGKWFTASFSVGDGGVAIFDQARDQAHDLTHDRASGQVRVLCRPDSGEFAGQTRFLTASEFRDGQQVMDRIFVDVRDSFTVLAAMTDGITDPKFPTDAVLADPQVWTRFWQDDLGAQVALHPDNPALEPELLGWLGFWSRGNHDDRTIALLVPDPVAVDAALPSSAATGDSG